MQDSTSVITQATKGIVEDLAHDREVGLSRMYEILGKDNPYPKAKKLIRDIARHNQIGARLIRSDMNAMWEEILEPVKERPTAIDLHKEASDAIQSVLANKSKGDQQKELRELITVAKTMLEVIEKETADTGNVRQIIHEKVESRRVK